jgi:hypothetical protein
MFADAQQRDFELIDTLFVKFDQNSLYIEVFSIYLSLSNNAKLYTYETSVLLRYLWKYQFLKLKEFKQYR